MNAACRSSIRLPQDRHTTATGSAQILSRKSSFPVEIGSKYAARVENRIAHGHMNLFARRMAVVKIAPEAGKSFERKKNRFEAQDSGADHRFIAAQMGHAATVSLVGGQRLNWAKSSSKEELLGESYFPNGQRGYLHGTPVYTK